MSRVLQIVLGIAVFLVAAKLHGRQLRLEREQAGIKEVAFGRRANNDPFVVALWRRERFIFWPAAVVSAVALHFFAVPLAWPLVYVVIPGVVGFCLGTILSLVRMANWRRCHRGENSGES